MIDPFERRSIAMRIAALLPADQESADSVLGLVADLQHWLSAPASSGLSEKKESAARPAEAESDFAPPTSYDLSLRQFRRLEALAQLVFFAEQHDGLEEVEGLSDLLKDAARAAGDILELMLAEREGKNG